MPLGLGIAVVEDRDHAVEQVGGALLHEALEAAVQLGQLAVLLLHELGELSVLLPERVGVEGLPDGAEQLEPVPRLGEDAEDLAVVDRVHRGAEVVRGGDEDADGRGLHGPGAGEEVRPGHPRHHVVGRDDLELPLLHRGERLRGIEAGGHFIAGGLEGPLQRVQDWTLVVDYQKPFHVRHESPSKNRHCTIPGWGFPQPVIFRALHSPGGWGRSQWALARR